MENSTMETNRRWKRKMSEANLNKSPSAPDLASENSGLPSLFQDSKTAVGKGLGKGSPKSPSRSQRESVCPLEIISSNLLLRPNHLYRQALSMDNPFYESYECCTPPSLQQSRRSDGSRESFEMELGSSAGVSGSQTSMALDLHDCQVTLKVKDESASKRSDTARRHQLLRQKPVEDDVAPRSSYVPRLLYPSYVEECSARTKSSTNLKSPCHHCIRATGCCGHGYIPKITPDFRSQSFSQAHSQRCTFHEDSCKIFCIENHRRANHSSENIRCCCEEKSQCGRKMSPTISPHRSPRTECRVQRMEGSECLIHRKTDQGCFLFKNNAKKRKRSHKIQGSLSVEEEDLRSRRSEGTRSASFSPTGRKPTTPTLFRGDRPFPPMQSLRETKPNEKTEPEEPS